MGVGGGGKQIGGGGHGPDVRPAEQPDPASPEKTRAQIGAQWSGCSKIWFERSEWVSLNRLLDGTQ